MSSTIHVRVSGRDRPGITAGLMALLAEGGVELFDVEQVVVRDHLTLGLLLSVPDDRSPVKELLLYGWENDLQIDFEPVEGVAPPAPERFVVTVIGGSVGPGAFGAVASAIAGAGGNIDRIVRLSRYPVVSYELAVGGGDHAAMRVALGAAAAENQVDIAVQREGIDRRAKRLVILDVDSTLIQGEVIDLLAAEAGAGERSRAITEAAMAGDLDFTEALRERVRLLRGLEVEAVERVSASIPLTPGARTFVTTLRRLGMKVAIVSGGFTLVTDRLKDELRLDYAVANVLEVADGRLTGEVTGQVVDRARKAEVLREIASAEAIPLEQTVAVGDGANDLDMLATAGLGIAFNARPVVKEAAETALTVPYLDAVLFLLGIRRDEVDSDELAPVRGLPPL